MSEKDITGKRHSGDEVWEHKEAIAAAGRFSVQAASLSIDELKQRANGYHAAVLEGVRTTLTAAKDCGAVLAHIKIRLEHGEWGGWLKENFAASESTAQRYIRIANNWHILQLVIERDGPEMPGVKQADEMIRTFHKEIPATLGGKIIPPPPPGRSQQLVKSITASLRSYLKNWPDVAIEYLDEEFLAVIDSIEVYVQEHFETVSYPEVLPRIAIREKATEMKLIRAFIRHINELTDAQQVELVRQLDEPGVFNDLLDKPVQVVARNGGIGGND